VGKRFPHPQPDGGMRVDYQAASVLVHSLYPDAGFRCSTASCAPVHENDQFRAGPVAS
jgi:hypothetical protein